MRNKNKKSNLVGLIFLILIIIGIIWFLNTKNINESIVNIDNNSQQAENQYKPISLCYYRSTETNKGFYDKAWLLMNIMDNKVNGKFYNLPAESDSKVGSFEGEVGPLVPELSGRKADVWWDSLAEGMQVKEELLIIFGEGSATVGFGEMVDRGDGVYVYKNKENLYFIDEMNQIDCDSLEEKLALEKYIRDNISNIATNDEVLGGTWNVISVTVNPSNKTSNLIYEDGHVQNKAQISYNYDKITQKIEIKNFEIIK